jgi:V/A-type H+-transporting ATPase subunit C
MDRLIIDEEIRHLFRIPYDFHNAKLLLKRRLSGIETPITLSEFGTIPRDVIQDAFDTENFNPLPEFMREAVGQAMAHHYLKKDLKSMEFIIDNLEYGALRTLVQKISIPFLSAFVAAKIDLTNIATFLRIKYFETQDSVVEAIIEGGTLDFLFFMKLMGETFESVAALFRNSPYHEIVDLGTRKILESGSFSALDRETENYLMRFMKHTRYITFGAEPLFAYFAAREQDLNIIKMILVGKLNELSKDDMRERLPITYNQ